jgi:hypothetical protein
MAQAKLNNKIGPVAAEITLFPPLRRPASAVH